MRFKDYYESLGLDPDADAASIKQAYRRLARQHHPDLHPGPDAQQAMAQINEAYEVLSEPARREAYDGVRRRHRSADPELASDWQQGFEFEGTPTAGRGEGKGVSEFFTGLFGRAAKPEPADAKPLRGSDAHVKLAIDLADAFQGALRSVTVCTVAPDVEGRHAVAPRKLQVQIPKGVRAGQHIRVPGQGNVGSGGAPAGDLYLEIDFKPQSQYRIHGLDLHGSVALAPWEAALGAEIEVATPGGPVQLSIPPDSPHGQLLRLKGRGLPGDPPGDLLLELRVVLPPAAEPKARAIYETMARELADGFRPRQLLRGAPL